MLRIRVILAGALLVAMPLSASAETISSAASKGAAASFGMIVKQGKNESGGSFSETIVTKNLAEFYSRLEIAYPGAVTEGGAGGPPPTISEPGPGAFPDYVGYVQLSAVANGFIRWTTYGRDVTYSGGAYTTGAWQQRSDYYRSAPATCRPGNLDNCPTNPQ